MRGCDDGSDAPEGTIADLREDLASVAADLRAEAETNRAARAEGEPVSAKQGRTVPIEPEKQPPFNPRVALLVAHFGEGERRPIPRRPERLPRLPFGAGDDLDYAAALRSESVSVLEGGEPMDPTPLDPGVVRPGNTYTVECTVRNVGGLPARNVYVELYVEHRRPGVTMDTNDAGAVELDPRGGLGTQYPGYYLSGVTTMAPQSEVTVMAHMGGSGGPPYDRILGWDDSRTVTWGRTFHATLNTGVPYDYRETGKPDRFLRGGTVPADESDFTLEVWDTTATNSSGFTETTDYDFFRDPRKWFGVHLGSVPGTFTTDPGVDQQPRDLTSRPTDDRTALVGKRTTAVPASGSRTVSFEYTPAAGEMPPPNEGLSRVESQRDLTPGIGEAVTVFYARAYSLATAELPADWGALDHTTSRFMGRAEVNREA